MPKDHHARRQHQALVRAWITLVRDRAKRLNQRQHDEVADQWDHHRVTYLETTP